MEIENTFLIAWQDEERKDNKKRKMAELLFKEVFQLNQQSRRVGLSRPEGTGQLEIDIRAFLRNI